MALQPKDLQKPIQDELERIDKLEKAIDAEMIKRYSGEGNFTFSLDKYINKRVFDEIKRRYHGWKLTQGSCQKDGDWITFTPVPISDNYGDK